jgi:hypothetical protein
MDTAGGRAGSLVVVVDLTLSHCCLVGMMQIGEEEAIFILNRPAPLDLLRQRSMVAILLK